MERKGGGEREKQQRDIAIFWDYENVPLPEWCNPADAARKIYNAVSRYGRIVDRRLYFDPDKPPAWAPRDASGLDLSGFDLVHTPTRNAKETLDKKLIADALTFGWDCAVSNRAACVVLVTGDGDYAYALSKLRDRGVMNVVMFGRDWTVAKILVDNADVALSFERDVLGRTSQEKAGKSKAATPQEDRSYAFVFVYNLPRFMQINDLVRFFEETHNAPIQRANVEFHEPKPGISLCVSHVQFVDPKDGERIIHLSKTNDLVYMAWMVGAKLDRKVPSVESFATKNPHLFYVKPDSSDECLCSDKDMASDVANFCAFVCNKQKEWEKGTGVPFEQCWIPSSVIEDSFQPAPPQNTLGDLSTAPQKEMRKKLCNKSVAEGFVQLSRRKLNDKRSYVCVALGEGLRDGLSRGLYVRLTDAGRLSVEIDRQQTLLDIPSRDDIVSGDHGFLHNHPRST